MTGYRLHIEADTAEPTAFFNMSQLHADQRRLAREAGVTYAEVVRMSYVMTEAEYQKSTRGDV